MENTYNKLKSLHFDRNDDGTYNVIQTMENDKGEQLSYTYPRVGITWFSGMTIFPLPLQTELFKSE